MSVALSLVLWAVIIVPLSASAVPATGQSSRDCAHSPVAAMIGGWHVVNCSSLLPIVTLVNVTIVSQPGGFGFTQGWSEGTDSPSIIHQFAAGGAAPIASRVFPWNIFLGVEYNISAQRLGRVVACPADSVAAAITTDMLTSQGMVASEELHTFRIAPSGANMTYTISGALVGAQTCQLERVSAGSTVRLTPGTDLSATNTLYGRQSTSPPLSSVKQQPAVLKFVPRVAPRGSEADARRSGNGHAATVTPGSAQATAARGLQEAFNYNVPDVWGVRNSSLHETALMLSLQGLANRRGPELYLTYPPNWAFSYTPIVRRAWGGSFNLSFTNISSAAHALSIPRLLAAASCYVVWDPLVRESLMVAFTSAGVHGCVVVTEEYVPLVVKAGLAMQASFVNQFLGQTPTQIYAWSFREYFDECDPHTVSLRANACMRRGCLVHENYQGTDCQNESPHTQPQFGRNPSVSAQPNAVTFSHSR